jgi:hypothetical protein
MITTEQKKTVCLSIMLILIGNLFAILDYYNGEKDLIPRLPFLKFLDEKPKYNILGEYDISTGRIVKFKTSVNSAFYLFIMFGCMFLVFTTLNIKSPYLLYDYPKIYYTKTKIYLINKSIEYQLFRLYHTNHNKVYHKTNVEIV